MADLGSAYVNIIPKAPGIEKELKNLLGNNMPDTSKQGQKLGSGLVSGLKKAVAGAAIGKVIKDAFEAGGDYEQLAGGVEKIFAGMDTSKIFSDAADAFQTLNLSANDYLSIINDVGASFAASMGAEAGYKTAQKGLQAISDYASGTGKSVDLLSQKFAMITRSTSSYMSIADQFSGILPATSADFLAQAKAAGFLASSYTELSQVPIAEYQAAVASMLERGVENLNLTGNTAKETATTLTSSFAAMSASWTNVLAAMTTGEGLDTAVSNLATAAGNFINVAMDMFNQFLSQVPALVMGIGGAIVDNAPQLIASAAEMIGQLVVGFLEGIPSFVENVPTFFSEVSASFSQIDWASIGSNLVNGIISGVQAAASALWEAVTNLASTALNKVKSVLGIASPSKVFENEVGRWIPEGMAVGIETNLVPVKSSVDAMAATAKAELQRATAPGMSMTAALGQPDAYANTAEINEIEVRVNFIGSLSQLARILQPEIEVVTHNKGPQMSKA